MPKEKEKLRCVKDQRNAEYYGMQRTFDELYALSKQDNIFHNLMDVILKRENILLAYRNIKTNGGSITAGTDGLTITDISKMSPEEVVAKVRFILCGSAHGYRPKPVRRKDIPKPNGKTRPLGIPCIWDRLVQQCIKQVLEPICEAKFSDNSYGFRPNRSVEQAIARTYQLMQRSQLHYVVEFDIKGFFDNVDHSKLIKQIWSLGIHDNVLIDKIKRILKAPIKMPDGKVIYPSKGTPQGGIISPLLANIVLNELDHWVESQWQENPVCYRWKPTLNSNGSLRKSGYLLMRTKTNLKEMWIVRYADDFRIFCRTKIDAEKTKIAVTEWLRERLRLEVSPEKTRTVNAKKRHVEFLGFKIKLHNKSNKMVVMSNISDKQLGVKKDKLIEQAKNIARPRKGKNQYKEVTLYNSMVRGMHNYYSIATHISADVAKLQRAVSVVLDVRLRAIEGSMLRKDGRKLTKEEMDRYGKSKMLRYVVGVNEPIYPIGYTKFRKPQNHRFGANVYSPEGRSGLHDNLQINLAGLVALRNECCDAESIELFDNRLSLYSAQWGKCAITSGSLTDIDNIKCYRKNEVDETTRDSYSNLVLMCNKAYELTMAVDNDEIDKILSGNELDTEQIAKINKLRIDAGKAEIILT